MLATLEAAREVLANIPGVASCKVGIEQGITAADYPMIRLVPSRITPGRPYNNRTAETLIYFGMDVTPADKPEGGGPAGLEGVYLALFSLEAEILARLKAMGHRYIETITDEDRLDTYKLMTIRAELVGTQPAP
jgi:hypothetical protein